MWILQRTITALRRKVIQLRMQLTYNLSFYYTHEYIYIHCALMQMWLVDCLYIPLFCTLQKKAIQKSNKDIEREGEEGILLTQSFCALMGRAVYVCVCHVCHQVRGVKKKQGGNYGNWGSLGASPQTINFGVLASASMQNSRGEAGDYGLKEGGPLLCCFSWNPASVSCFTPPEFMKTLLLMEATLKAENEVSNCSWNKIVIFKYVCWSNTLQELLQRKAELQAAIKQEAELIDQYKVQNVYSQTLPLTQCFMYTMIYTAPVCQAQSHCIAFIIPGFVPGLLSCLGGLVGQNVSHVTDVSCRSHSGQLGFSS